MAKAKFINDSLVSLYIKEKRKQELQDLEVEKLQKQIRFLANKGYTHPLLLFKDNNSWRPNWKVVCMELMKKYMAPGPASMFLKGLRKRFKPTEGEKQIIIEDDKFKNFRQDLKAQKGALGLLSKSKKEEEAA